MLATKLDSFYLIASLFASCTLIVGKQLQLKCFSSGCQRNWLTSFCCMHEVMCCFLTADQRTPPACVHSKPCTEHHAQRHKMHVNISLVLNNTSTHCNCCLKALLSIFTPRYKCHCVCVCVAIILLCQGNQLLLIMTSGVCSNHTVFLVMYVLHVQLSI